MCVSISIISWLLQLPHKNRGRRVPGCATHPGIMMNIKQVTSIPCTHSLLRSQDSKSMSSHRQLLQNNSLKPRKLHFQLKYDFIFGKVELLSSHRLRLASLNHDLSQIVTVINRIRNQQSSSSLSSSLSSLLSLQLFLLPGITCNC